VQIYPDDITKAEEQYVPIETDYEEEMAPAA
jgi:hypothetical protein